MPLLRPFLVACETYANTIRALMADFQRDCDELYASYQAVIREIDSKLQRSARESYEKHCGAGPVCEHEEEYFQALREAEAEARRTADEAYQWLQDQKKALSKRYEGRNEETFRTYLSQLQVAWGTIDPAAIDSTQFTEVNCLLPQLVESSAHSC